MSRAKEFVALRRKLLLAELKVARTVGRNKDADTIGAELRSLEVSPADALLTRVKIGLAVAGSRPTTGPGGHDIGPRALASQMEAAKRRLAELDAELAEWRSARR